FDEKTLVRLAGHDGGTTVAALEEVGTAIELQVAFLFVASVALVAMLDQDGPNFLFEELDAYRVRSGSRRRVEGRGKDQPCRQGGTRKGWQLGGNHADQFTVKRACLSWKFF